METASDIFQMLLRNSGLPLMNGDFASFSACFKLPQTITTPQGMRTLMTTEDLRILFDEVRGFFEAQGVTMITRNCVRADFAGEATVLAVHESFLPSSEGLVRAPYEVFSIIERHAEGWHVTFSDFALGDSLDHCRVLCAAGVEPAQQPSAMLSQCQQSRR